MSSQARNPKALEADPGNDLLWRQNLRRLEAEVIRDSILGISGQLNLKMGGRGFFPHLAGEVLAGASRPGLDWLNSSVEERSRRSVYTYIRRTMLVPTLDAFDYSNTASPLGERPVTTVAPQALMLLNDDFMEQQAATFATRLTREAGNKPQEQIQRGYQLAAAREPTSREMRVASAFLQRQTTAFKRIPSRLTFRPDVPNSLSVEYINQLKPSEFLVGPQQGWSYYRGRWSAAYEGIRTVDRQRAPFALWDGQRFENGVIAGKLVLDRASEFASILFRAGADKDELRGYELIVDPRQQRLILRRHQANTTDLATIAATLPVGQSIPLKIDLAGARIRVWLNGAT